MNELKPANCPFCGGAAELDTRQGYTYLKSGQPRHGTRIAVYCTECSADIGICREDVPDANPELVVEMWSRRAPTSPPAPAGEVRQAMEKALVVLDMVLEYPEFDCDNAAEPRPLCAFASEAIAALRAALASPIQPLSEERTPVIAAREFYNRSTGHAIVDYSAHTHRGHLTREKGYLTLPLIYANGPTMREAIAAAEKESPNA